MSRLLQPTRDLDHLSPWEVAQGLCHLPGLVFLDSSSVEATSASSPEAARFSLVAARPEQVVKSSLEDLAPLRRALAAHRRPTQPDLGMPLGGAVGWVDYEGTYCFGIYPDMLVFDHARQAWLEVGSLADCVRSPRPETPPRLAPFSSDHDAASFSALVRRAQNYIAAGDIYQVNLAHRFATTFRGGPGQLMALYERLRHLSPAPYAGFLTLGGRSVLSSSPELFLEISGSSVKTRPIKGTRPRFRDPAQDEKSAYDLLTSPKEVSELVMITDLERNDLGQICEFGSVAAAELLKLERYEQVFHLVSTVVGTLRPEIDHLDTLRACFPGGSITGAPKRRAREIIDELEDHDRGLYTGTLGIIGFNGESRFNIAIRTAIAERGQLHFHVGAGIVADSDPLSEYEETLHKAGGLLRLANAGD